MYCNCTVHSVNNVIARYTKKVMLLKVTQGKYLSAVTHGKYCDCRVIAGTQSQLCYCTVHTVSTVIEPYTR